MGVEGTQWPEEGIESGWRTYGMGVDVYGRDEGEAGGKEAREGRGDEAKMKEEGGNIKKMRRVVGLLKEGSDRPRSEFMIYFIKSRSLAEPISEAASMAGPIAKL